jgi:hypothetical protein
MLQVSFKLTNAQEVTFTSFFYSVQGGALPFNWADPVSGSPIVVRMTGEVNGPNYIDANLWEVSFQVEVLP